MRICLAAAFFFSVASAQSFPPLFQDPIDSYLTLTEPQRQKLNGLNAEFSRWLQGKNERMRQVNGEITLETQRDPLDPGALGVRYAELEVIRREIKDRGEKLVAEAQAVLTEPQKMKLKALEEAMKLQPAFYAAQARNLLLSDCGMSFGNPTVPTSAFGRWFDTDSFLPTYGFLPGLSPCSLRSIPIFSPGPIFSQGTPGSAERRP